MNLFSTELLKLNHIEHAFGSKLDPIPIKMKNLWEEKKPDHKQVHGIDVAEVLLPRQNCQEVDGIFTQIINQPIGVYTADCVPLLIAHREKNFIAALHAGWRGTFNHIHLSLQCILEKHSINPKDLIAAIGPCIHACCYEVDKNLIEKFHLKFNNILKKEEISPQKNRLDLVALNKKMLEFIGIPIIDTLSLCTLCSKDNKNNLQFHSYRRNATSLRQYSMLTIKKIDPA